MKDISYDLVIITLKNLSFKIFLGEQNLRLASLTVKCEVSAP